MSRISVVIPLLDGAATIEACLESVLSQSVAAAEVIVVDNGSRDGGPERVAAWARRDPRVRLLAEPVRGAAAARNRGWRASSGDWVVFLDSDCEAGPGWLEGLSAVFGDPDVGLVGGRIRGSQPRNPIEKALAISATQDPQPPHRFERYELVRGGLPAGNLAARRELLEALDGFDPSFRIGEDHDLCARAIAAGWVLRFTSDASVAHHNHGSLGGQVRQSYGYGRAHAHLLERHGAGAWWVMLPRRSWKIEPLAGRAWLAIDTPTKLLPLLAVAAWIQPWALLALGYYLFHYVRSTHRLLEHHQIPTQLGELLVVACMRGVRAVAIDAGRLVGSIERRVLCL